jgi:hypothetical protein
MAPRPSVSVTDGSGLGLDTRVPWRTLKPPNIPDDFDEFVAVEASRQQWDVASSYAVPDLRLIFFRLLALSAAGSALLVAAGVFTGGTKVVSDH